MVTDLFFVLHEVLMYIAVGTYIYITLVPLCELWEVVLFVVYTLIALVSFCIRDFLTVYK